MDQLKRFKFIQHIPTFVECEPKIIYFDNINELLETELLKGWSRSDNDYKFERFSLLNDDNKKLPLMAEYKGYKKWWLLGFITGNETDLHHLRKLLPEFHANNNH